MFERLLDAISRVLVGNNTTDNLNDLKESRERNKQARREIDKTINDAELLRQVKQTEVNTKEGKI